VLHSSSSFDLGYVLRENTIQLHVYVFFV